MLKDKKIAIIAAIFAMVLWGSALPVIKGTYLELGVSSSNTGAQILLAGIRFFLAGLLAFLYLKLFNKEPIIKSKIDYKYIIALALIQTALQYMFYYVGLGSTTGVKSAIIQATNSFIIVILSLFLLPNEKIKLNTLIAIIVGTLGIVVANGGFSNFKAEFNPLGDGMIFLATSCNALASIFVRKYGKDQNEFLTTATQFCLGAIPLIVVGLMSNDIKLNFTFKAILLLSYGAFISATAYTIRVSILRHYNASEMGMYKLFIPVFGSIFSIMFLGEIFTKNLFMGLILVLVGSFVLNISNIRRIKR